MDFIVFLLVNANLFLRPAELVPVLERLPLYYWFILACILVSVPRLLGLLTSNSPLRHPVTLCVFGISFFVVLSHLTQSDLERTAEEAFDFAKVVVYFVLFLALVNSPGRLRILLASVVLFGMFTTGVAVLEYHELIDLPNLQPHADEMTRNDSTGVMTNLKRLMLTGILHDPNEFCVFLGVLGLFTLHQLSSRRLGFFRFVWLAPLGLFLYGIHLTQSRGGLLALLAGLGVYAVCAWGWRRTLTLGAVALPALLLMLALGGGDRQTSMSLQEGTGRARVELWSDWMMKFRANPIFGEGPKLGERTLAERKASRWEYQQVAHNSYLQGFADLGILGGMLFLGSFCFAFRSLARLRGPQVAILDPELRRLYPFLFGALAAYMMGMMSLSLCYVLPTYFMLAASVTFARLTVTEPRVAPVSFDGAGMRHLVFASVGMLAFIFVLIKVLRV